ncbi:MAG: TIGR02757 family protein, partial [Bacteroidota bacterium]
PVILRNANRLMQYMDDSPHQFVLHHSPGELKPFRSFVHRTFNGTDAVAFIRCLRNIYGQPGGLEAIFRPFPDDAPESGAHITRARNAFFSIPHPQRTRKHFADPSSGAAAKRINMFLRWMVRNDGRGVDFGIWRVLAPSQLYCPLDVHSGRVARGLGLLHRKQDDWKAVVELTANLRKLDPDDPVKYDIALFGFGVEERRR